MYMHCRLNGRGFSFGKMKLPVRQRRIACYSIQCGFPVRPLPLTFQVNFDGRRHCQQHWQQLRVFHGKRQSRRTIFKGMTQSPMNAFSIEAVRFKFNFRQQASCYGL